MIEKCLKEINQELREIGNPENDYKRFIELLQEKNNWREMMSDVMSFEQFEKIYDTARKLLQITTDLFNLNDDMEQVSDIIYIEIMRLHNVAVDFIKAYQDLKNKEE